MTDKKKKRVEFTTPRGVFAFPKLAVPDTKFDTDGRYSVKVRFADEAAAAMIAMLADPHAAAIAAGEIAFNALPVATRKKMAAKGIKAMVENPFYSPVYDKETEEETGEIEVNFGCKAGGVSKATQKPWKRKPIQAFDSKGKLFKATDKIWSGTVGKVRFSISEYFVPGTGAAGLSLGLEAVQIIELSGPGAGRSAAGYGFDVEEDGFEANEEDAAPVATDEDENDDAAGADF